MADSETGSVLSAAVAQEETPDIVFANIAPIRATNQSPVVFIGLGGSGAELVSRVRRLLKANYGDNVPSTFQFMVIDTTPKVQELFRNDPGVKVSIMADFNGNTYITRGGKRDVSGWWPNKYWPGSISDGAGQARATGRLALFHDFSDISSAIQTMVVNANIAVGIGAAPPLVYILGSTCGGTGAGLAIDISYIARNAFLSQGRPNAMSIAVLLGRSAFWHITTAGAAQQIPANTYAMLKELNYLHYSIGLSPTYPGDVNVDPSNLAVPRPFDILYYVDNANAYGKTSEGKAQLLDTVANYLVAEYFNYKEEKAAQAAAGAGNVLSHLDNARSFISAPVHGVPGVAPLLSSFGYAALVYPSQRIKMHALFRLGAAMVREGLLKTPQSFDAAEEAQRFVNDAKLDEKNSDAVLDSLRKALSDSAGSIQKVSASSLVMDNLVLTGQRLDQFEKHLADVLSHQTERIGRARSQLRENALKALDQGCTDHSNTHNGGPTAVRDFLSHLAGMLDGYKDMLLGELQKEADQAEKETKRRADALAEAKRTCMQRTLGVFPKRTETRECVETYVAACKKEFAHRVGVLVRSEAIALYEALIGEIKRRVAGIGLIEAELGRCANAWLARAEQLISEMRSTDTDTDSLQVAFYALKGPQIQERYDAYLAEMNVDPGKLRQKLSGNHAITWKWLTRVQQDNGVHYFRLALSGAELAQAVETAISSALAELINKNMMEALGETNVQRLLAEMVGQCAPMWTITDEKIPDTHRTNMPKYSIISVQTAGDPWQTSIAAMQNMLPGGAANSSVVETGDPNRVAIAVSAYGAPVYAHTQYDSWKTQYTKRVREYDDYVPDRAVKLDVGGPKPVHIIDGWQTLPGPEPMETENYEIFAKACAFPVPLLETANQPTPHIIERSGGWYYIYAYPEQQKPLEKRRLGQGMLKAWDAFAADEQLINSIKQWFGAPSEYEYSVISIGNDAMVKYVEEQYNQFRKDWMPSASRTQDEIARAQLVEKLITGLMSFYETELHGDSQLLQARAADNVGFF